MAERTDEDWQSFVQSKVSDISLSSSRGITGPLASISSPTDPRFPLAIDHTLLKPDATPAQIDVLCDEAIEYGFKVGQICFETGKWV
jgi:deoxyribose-phosphate aldolase